MCLQHCAQRQQLLHVFATDSATSATAASRPAAQWLLLWRVWQGVQLLLDAVTSYLPCPLDVESVALDAARGEEQVRLSKSRDGACCCTHRPVVCAH